MGRLDLGSVFAIRVRLAAKNDPALYDLLALVDALRIGRSAKGTGTAAEPRAGQQKERREWLILAMKAVADRLGALRRTSVLRSIYGRRSGACGRRRGV